MATEYFTLTELRALPDMSSATEYPDATCEAEAAAIVDIIERVVGTSFIARTITDEVHDGGCYSIVLNAARVLAITSVTENGVAISGSELSLDAGVLERFVSTATYPTLWARGRRNIKVTYTSGYSTLANIPDDIKRAALLGTRARLLESSSDAGVDDRRTSLSNDMGTINFVIAGEDRPTGYPVVDEIINGWRRRLAPSMV